MQSSLLQLAVAGVLVATPAMAAGGPRRAGKVVRVPRPAPMTTSSIRTCSFTAEGTALCNLPVEASEVGIAIDDDQNRGPAIVRRAVTITDRCGKAVQWAIEVELTGGGDAPGRGVLVFDHPVEERATTLPAPTEAVRPGERVSELVDSDGDGRGDLRLTSYACDRHGALQQTTRPSHQCTDTWLAQGDRWRRVRAERVAVCPR